MLIGSLVFSLKTDNAFSLKRNQRSVRTVAAASKFLACFLLAVCGLSFLHSGEGNIGMMLFLYFLTIFILLYTLGAQMKVVS